MGAFLAGLLAAVKGKAALMAGGAALAAAGAAVTKFGPGLVGRVFGALLDKPLKLENPEDRELGVAVVRWVEKKIPDQGLGAERYKMAAQKLVRMFPALASQEAHMAEFIEASVKAMDDEAKKRN